MEFRARLSDTSTKIPEGSTMLLYLDNMRDRGYYPMQYYPKWVIGDGVVVYGLIFYATPTRSEMCLFNFVFDTKEKNPPQNRNSWLQYFWKK